MEYAEFRELSRELMQHHSIFQKFWKMGNIEFSEKVKTAAVEFDKLGECINFYINEKFWKTISLEKKKFVIAHECLHVLFYHGIRASLLKESDTKQIANVAMDVVVNYTLIDSFGFNKEEIDPGNEYCWVETVFKDQNIPTGKSFEYYFNLLQQKQQQSGGDGKNKVDQCGSKQPGQPGNKLVDEHDLLESFNNKKFEDQIQDALDNYDTQNISEMVQEQCEDIKQQIKQAGLNPGGLIKIAKFNKIIKKKWETIIKQWSKKYNFDKETEQWIHKNRRMSSMPSDLMLPSDYETESEEKNRIDVWFFLDTSGSCAHLGDRFFSAAASLDPKHFDVKLFCFDTHIYETSLKTKKLSGFGGTTFSCINNYINKECNNRKHPSAIFVISDGYANSFNPAFPKKWYFFLTESYLSCIPKEANIFYLRDYE